MSSCIYIYAIMRNKWFNKAAVSPASAGQNGFDCIKWHVVFSCLRGRGRGSEGWRKWQVEGEGVRVEGEGVRGGGSEGGREWQVEGEGVRDGERWSEGWREWGEGRGSEGVRGGERGSGLPLTNDKDYIGQFTASKGDGEVLGQFLTVGKLFSDRVHHGTGRSTRRGRRGGR